MGKKSYIGIACLKYHQISISDKCEEASIEVKGVEVNLVEELGNFTLEMKLDISILGIKELWKVGINHFYSSSELLEPFDVSILRISIDEIIVRLSATCNVSDSEDHLLSFEVYSKFKLKIPSILSNLDMFYDVSKIL